MSIPGSDDPTRAAPVKPAEAATLVPASPIALTALPNTPAGMEPCPERVHVPGYEVLGVLGRGGMGVVYKARQTKLNRLVALKMILAGGHACESDLVRFRAEAEAVACLQHPNIVQIYEVDEAEGRPFFSLEFCAGGSLGQRLDGTPWAGMPAARLVETLARAMEAAHQAGIVHRDLKPANILLVPPRRAGAASDSGLVALKQAASHSPELGTPKITDFGVAKRLDGSTAKTVTGAVVGTPSYMAPEQAGGKGQDVGPAADVYALGAILYELLTGRPPFKGATPIDTVMQVIAEDPVSPRRLQPRVPRDLETICLKCLHKLPKKRYDSAAALADDLKRFLDGEPVLARPTPFWERAAKWAKRRPTSAALLGLTVLVLLGAYGVSWKEERERRENRVNYLVESLIRADVNELPNLLEKLEPLHRYTDPSLAAIARDTSQDPGLRLRAYLALSTVDEGQVEYMSWRLLDCSLREFPLVRNRLSGVGKRLVGSLFEVLHDDADQPAEARFRAGLALADYAPDDAAWTEADFAFLAAQLLDTGRGDQRDVREYLRPLASRLLPPLQVAFRDDKARTATRLAAADALADLARDDAARLARLGSEATAEQFGPFRTALAELQGDDAAQATLRELIREMPSGDLDSGERIRLGRRRAGAAISLLLLGDHVGACEVLHGSEDPEAATQFIHGLRERGATVRHLLPGLDKAEDTAILFGVLLALGEFPLGDLPSSARDELPARLLAWYRDDPRAAIHGAAGWLLRTWGFGKEADRVDRTPVPLDRGGRREWFVEKIGDDCFTFIVCPPGEFRMGSPPNEAFRRQSEGQHQVRLTRPFALCDRELTAEQFARFCRAASLPPPEGDEAGGGGAAHPVVNVTWPAAVLYCRWLTATSGLPEARQCYDDVGPPQQALETLLKAKAFHPERFGFRLPTEAEWEYACRAGTTTAYSFGNDTRLLPYYGRHLQGGSAPVGQLRPNRRGLFDMHGNAWEWCQDWYQKELPDGDDPAGSADGRYRALRGGGWDRGPWHCRSAYRHSPTPDYRGAYMGIRLARTLPR